MAHLDAIRVEVERLKTVKESNRALLLNLAAKIEELKTDPAELQALADELRANVDEISADIIANTPV